ncbi:MULTISPECIES: PAS domain S-box protein [Stenotrophomonas]|jgi:diguanylate cyclase (GGDEF)-like protein/PAS domain S-box-containing protein|uniref:PAS domain S-box protein n=1 Tax=Stenotrophomonas TaxID=40323 RepID=UPI00046F8C4B|nr:MULTISPECIES: PAS domain S-box protein [Stenotrophomonas]QGL64037.1 PAS domain S-box protein [Stenotrophomonas maltophilia]AVJ33638.1 GGDEF domain-containing protein [Stenotrophomonas sp. MYb57]MCK6232683.1 PAS domain S-box protein [Stenotrophomonas indicatrix]QBR44982.1 diguanylate cyclase, GGDEF domain [Stenotrophomonas indicatrix]TPD72311.1 PAS domain S-box protein [Stenotrophomonas maltophilia]
MADQGNSGNALLERRLQELAEERRRLAMIIEGTAAGTWEWNVQSGQMRVNERWAEIVGYRLDELEPICQKTFIALVHPDDLALSDAALQDHFDGRTDHYVCLLRMRHRNGEWIWIHDRGRVFEWDGQGRPLWMAGAHADVTELQQARQDAAEMRQRLQAMVDASDEVAVIATDTDGIITIFNTGAQRLLGYTAAEVVGERRLDAFHDPVELQAWLRPLATADGQVPGVFEALSARAEGQTYSRQWTLLRKDGQRRQVRLSISRMDGANGERIGYVGMAIDITEILQARAEARLAAEKFAGAFTSAALGMALVSLEGRWLDVNDALCRILGYTREELLQVDFQRLTHPADLQTDLALVQDLLAGRRTHYHLEKRYLGREGNTIWARLSVSLVRNERGEPLHFVSQIQDVSAQRSSEQRLFESEQRSRITLDAVADLVLSVALDGHIEYANAAAVRMLAGDGALSLAGHLVQDVLSLTTEYAPQSQLDVSVLLDPESNAVDLHADLLLQMGTAVVPVDLTRAWLRDDEGQVRGAVWVLRDDTQQRAREREARHLAEMDPLTELGNRRGFEVHLQQAITRVERTGQAASLMYIDLDRFKPVNDTFGHLAGDAVLWAVASVLRHGVRDSDVVARLGGDEFAVILSGCSPRRAARIGGELLHTLANLSIPWDQHQLRIGASIGIAPLAAGMSVDQAVAAADAQCYRAKAMGRNNVQVQGETGELPGSSPADGGDLSDG